MKFLQPKAYQDATTAINKSAMDNMIPDAANISATAIPYTGSLYGDFLINPTTVSLNDFAKMAREDPIVFSCLKYLSTMIVSRIGQFKHDNKEIQDFINWTIDNLEIGRTKFFDGLMEALHQGFSANYKVWDYDEDDRPYYKNVIHMPSTSIVMAVEQDGSIKKWAGIMQYWYNTNLNGWANQFSYSDGYNNNPNAATGDFVVPLRVPYVQPIYLKPFKRSDILLYTITGNTAATNPYGVSMCRAIYTPWLGKNAVNQNFLIAITYKAAPLLLFYVNPAATVNYPNGAVGKLSEALSATLNNYQGNGYIIAEGEENKTINHAVIDNTAKVEDFITSMEYYDNQIRYGLLTPDSMLQSEGNYATSVSHGNVQQKIIAYMTDSLVEVLLTEFVKPQIQENWDEDDYGMFEILENTIDDKLKIAKLIESAYTSQMFNPNNLDQVNEGLHMVGLNEVDKIMQHPSDEAATNISDTRRNTKTPYADMDRWSLSEYFSKEGNNAQA